jgi:outer membrane murein-binding lipoprotein Lpp
MENEYLPMAVHEEFSKRIQDENDRQNHRLTNLEKAIEQISSITTSIERLATNMEHMVKEQQAQKDDINKVGERLKSLEEKDGDMWRKVVSHAITATLSIVIGYIASRIGLGS